MLGIVGARVVILVVRAIRPQFLLALALALLLALQVAHIVQMPQDQVVVALVLHAQ